MNSLPRIIRNGMTRMIRKWQAGALALVIMLIPIIGLGGQAFAYYPSERLFTASYFPPTNQTPYLDYGADWYGAVHIATYHGYNDVVGSAQAALYDVVEYPSSYSEVFNEHGNPDGWVYYASFTNLYEPWVWIGVLARTNLSGSITSAYPYTGSPGAFTWVNGKSQFPTWWNYWGWNAE